LKPRLVQWSNGGMDAAPGSTSIGGGRVAPGFELVELEFRRNFAERGEVGAAFAAVRNGECVVDLWGGLADPAEARAWEQDTLQLIFSGTKALVAVCMLILVDRGLLDPEQPVAAYWPEFAAGGKGDVLVRHVLSHQAGLPGVRAAVDEAGITDAAAMAELLAGQDREEDSRAYSSYHPLTYGWLCAELLRRVDGRMIGAFLAAEVTAPLGLELWLGLPPELEARVSKLVYGAGWGAKIPSEEEFAADGLLAATWNNPPLFPADRIPWNEPSFHQAEIPGGGAIAAARSVAHLFGNLCSAGGGEVPSLLSRETVDRARRCQTRRLDGLIAEPGAYGLGFEVQTELRRLGPPGDAFGHSGAGGSIHGAWPSHGVGYSYCMNEMRDEPLIDPRSKSLLDALHAAIERAS
jgi:CubicO group peptidase (beta-lactamase class C family)